MKKSKLTLLIVVCIAISFLGMFLSGYQKKSSATIYINKEEKNSEIAAKLDEYMKAYNENSTYKYSGTILVARGDEILLNKGYGMANYEENIPNEPDSVFAIGSISKTFTAVAIMQLQEMGQLNVNDPISKYIHGNKRGDDITIHHLLTHTSGLMRDGYLLKGPIGVSLDEDIDFINKGQMLFEPGEDFSYSNAGYIMLAAIIEKVSGKPYNDYIRDNIFIPLGMNSSRTGTDASYGDKQAVGYEILTDSPSKLLMFNFSCETGAGNIYSTVEDLYKYDRALYDGKLLSKDSIDMMYRFYSNGNYGYGWQLAKRYGRREYSHGGHIAGYNSSIIRYPDDDFVLIFLSNNDDYNAIGEVSRVMPAIVLGKDYIMPGTTKAAEVGSEILKGYAGEYKLGKDQFLKINYSNSKLYAEENNGISYELVPVSDKNFHYESHENIRIKFIPGKNNNSVELEVSSNGKVYKGKKVK